MLRENQTIVSVSIEETQKVGKRLANLLTDGDVVVLNGPLGAGKTMFIKGLARGLNVNDQSVKSPSYTLVNEYSGKFMLYHFDLYRMNDISELYHIGWDDYLLRDGIVVVEWGGKAEELLPQRRIDIEIAIIADNEREISIEILGD